jgi:hypothetical protein
MTMQVTNIGERIHHQLDFTAAYKQSERLETNPATRK